ncbi:MAG: serine/threonine-protein kinase [Planctomycetota bacterium]|nr:serine/threonine-protein kinase [Planctomycetota bacterium]
MTEHNDQFEPELDGFPIDMSPERIQGRDAVEVLATEFVDRSRRGERVTIDQYVSKYPQFEHQIRDLFPMIAALEQLKTEREAECLRRQLPESFEIKQLGDCEIVREIGRGAMGIVFEGLQGPLKRRVAVKLLPWRFSAVPRWRERFESEALMIAQLKHPNIVPIYSMGEHDEYAYFVMQYVHGVSLDCVIRRLRENAGVIYANEVEQLGHGLEVGVTNSQQSLRGGDFQHRELRRDSWSGFAKVVVQVAKALAYAHGEGILHNDIKPANLLLTPAGRASVTDFGLARNFEEAGEGENRLTGTLRYMAPERFELRQDQRSDLYSLGVTLYELATQQPVFRADDRSELIHQICTDIPRRPRILNRDIPPALETIILTAIARDPDERYQKASLLATDLLRFINGKSVLGHGSTLLQRTVRRFRQWRTRRT